MTTITYERLNTIALTADEIYEMPISGGAYIDLHNDTGGTLYVSESSDMDSSESIFISENQGFSGLYCNGTIYFKSTASGNLQIVVRG